MKILLVSPSYPITYWGFQYTLPFSGARAMLPPLGLITLAALLPSEWSLRLVDTNVEPLDDDALRWADAVFVGGMRVQADSMHTIVGRARALGRTTVVGGPAPTTAPEEWSDADVVFCGEAEGRIDELVAALADPAVRARGGQPLRLERHGGTPAMSTSPVPRFDLLHLDWYDAMSVQTSRGCPFRCEFCDIIEIFGRVPRIKSADQVVAEMERLRVLGWHGSVFVVDDNFIGNRPAVRKMLPVLTAFQVAHGFPFDLTTEASVDLAADHELVAAMVAAGFGAVFVGIESPDPATLKATQKGQNVRVDLQAAIASLSKAGLEVMAGFIVGFDQDGPDVFEAQRAFIQASPVPIAMAGILMALPQTQLSRRLAKEGRLRSSATGDQFGRPNFVPVMDEATLVSGYGKLLGQLYEPAAYFARVEANALLAGKTPGHAKMHLRDFFKLLKVMFVLGVLRPWRRHFWRLLYRTARKAPHNLRRAIVHAVMGEHMIRYTREHVQPRLAEALAALAHEGRAHVAPLALHVQGPVRVPAPLHAPVRARDDAGASQTPYA